MSGKAMLLAHALSAGAPHADHRLVLRHRNSDVFPRSPTPHFAAVYGEFEANIAIATGEVIDGRLPTTAARLVKQWTLAHQEELRSNWDRARANMPLERIAGLDAE